MEITNFDILNYSTWKFASDNVLYWKDTIMYDKYGNKITEKNMCEILTLILNLLERKEDNIGYAKKQKIIITILDKMIKYQSQPDWFNNSEDIKKEDIKENKNENFNPYDENTFSFATNNPLVINGIKIFNIKINLDGNEIKENVTEKDFIFMLKLLLTNNLGDRQIFINNYINQKIDNCTPINYTSNIMYGGYTFSDAQIETVNGLSESELEKIGKIVKSALLKRTKKYIIKQDLFTAILNWDSDYFVELAFVKTYSEEKEIMRSYFLEMCDFENEEEIITYFNLNDYLNKHTDLKIEITNKCLDSLRKSKEIQNKLEEKFEAEINAIDINDYKNKILTSKEAKSIKGRTLIYQSKNKYFVAISSAICGTISPCENLSKAIEYARTNSHKKAPIFISENRGRTYKLLDV